MMINKVFIRLFPILILGGLILSPSESAAIDVRRAEDIVFADTGAMRFEFDLSAGTLRRLSVGDKTLVDGNTEPPLFATLLESAEYDGVRDAVAHDLIASEYSCDTFEAVRSEGLLTISGKGVLDFAGGDAIDFEMTLKARPGASRLELGLTLAPRGEFRDRFVREVGLRQPLALNRLKRVVQAADQGLRFNTRHLYRFHAHTYPLTNPDYNIWRRFYIDQDTEHSFRIWRAEGEDTAGLHVFDGRRAAGWLSLYDEGGGALFGYRGISRRAPKLLYADAEGGGEGVFYIYGPTQPAFKLSDPRLSGAVFGAGHRMDILFFEGDESEARPDDELARVWGVERLPSAGPTEFRPVADEAELWDAADALDSMSPFVAGGLPLPRGAVRNAADVRLFARGVETPCQTRALGYWPDGSIKWLQLVFPLAGDADCGFSPGSGSGDEAEFRVTLRKGADVPCVLRYGGNVVAGEIGAGDIARMGAETVLVDTGALRAELGKGTSWLRSLSVDGREMLKAGGGAQAFVDFLRPVAYAEGRAHADGEDDPGPVEIERLEIEESGPLRSVLRLEGWAACREPARVIMRLEFYRGRSFARLLHSVEFMQKDPREVFPRAMGLRLPLALGEGRVRVTAGGERGAAPLPEGSMAGLRQTRHVNYEAWSLDDGVRRIADTGHMSRGWLDAADDLGGVTVVQRSMWQEGPKELLYRAGEGVLEIGLWPGSSPLMDVRRYSNYPHRAQGETVGTNPGGQWVRDWYYPNDPFVGVSRTHESLLVFRGPRTDLRDVESVVADFQSQPLVYAGWPWYAETRVVLPQPDPADPAFRRFNENIDNVATWHLFHQKAWGWYGMWDYGDTHHAFRTGYGRVFMPESLLRLLEHDRDRFPKVPMKGLDARKDYYTQGDWAFDNGRWGWNNTEGLLNHYMSMQYLRTGRRDLFFFIEANARHVRDVDARHAGMWFGRGTRHGVQHWSDGHHGERQTVFSEQRFHYFLTGEHRTREWSRELTEGHYLKGRVKTHSEHSGRTYGLLFNWEITGDTRVGEVLRRYVHTFAKPDGIDISPDVVFPSAECTDKVYELNSGNMFFHTFGAMHTLLEYYYITGDAGLRHSILKMGESALERNEKEGAPVGYLRKAVAFAARHAERPERYRAALEELCRAPNFYQQVPANTAHWTGPSAFFRNGVSGGLFWLSDMGYMMGGLPAEPRLPDRLEKEMRKVEQGERREEPRQPGGGWQSEYERPEFEEYLSDPRK